MTKCVVITYDGVLPEKAHLFPNREAAFKFAAKHQPCWILDVVEADAQISPFSVF